ncbi:uncharacterized protein LOC111003073 [Pieris rapae]|uniref:uncharacterized protein LOC111003073 n=1 Tax=Pieris rapae TaxID=64459 RepID=UPI000B92A09F|nr:uncharacterized protein LOC111003073 [Pieris rapae]
MEKKRINKRDKHPRVKLPLIDGTSSDVRTILDTDPHFYTLIDGRPIRPNKSILKYKQDIRNITLKRTVYGFLTDEILRIDREIETERKKYETASKHFDEYQYSFDKFLAHDNNKTIAIMRKSDNLSKDLIKQVEEHKATNYEYATLKSKLQYIEETLQILVSFQFFLYNAAPIMWRETVPKPVDKADIFESDSNIFLKIDINAVKLRLSQLAQPCLYFETPIQLLNVFNTLEKQNLNYLLVTEELNAEKQQFLTSVQRLKILMDMELNFIEQKIKEIDDIIKCNVSRELELKDAFYKLLNKNIKYLVSSKTALQIFNYVEFAFEEIIAPNETNLSSLEMMYCLEREFNNIMIDLTAFDLNDVKVIEKEIYSEGVSQIINAKLANKLLKNVDKLNKRMKSAYEPSKRPVKH